MEMQKTKNYEMFRISARNRPICLNHLRKLKSEIAKKNLLGENPIIVTSDMLVVEGQHRLRAAQEMALDIFYIVSDQLKEGDMVTLNERRKDWSTLDFIHYYAGENKTYRMLEKLGEMYGVNPTAIMALVTYSSYETMKAGVLPELDGEVVANRTQFASEIISILVEKFSFGRSSFNIVPFFRVLKIILDNDHINLELFRKAIDQYGYLYKPYRQGIRILESLIEIYNYKRKTGRLRVFAKNSTSFVILPE